MKKQKFLRTNSIAEKLGVKPRTVYRYYQLGLLKYTKPAGIIYVTEEEYNEFLKKRNKKKIRKNKAKYIQKGPRRMVRNTTKKSDTNPTKQNQAPDHSHNIAMD